MNNEPLVCKKCAHIQYEGTHCDFCGNPLKEKAVPEKRLTKFTVVRILGFVAIFVLFFVILYFVHRNHN